MARQMERLSEGVSMIKPEIIFGEYRTGDEAKCSVCHAKVEDNRCDCSIWNWNETIDRYDWIDVYNNNEYKRHILTHKFMNGCDEVGLGECEECDFRHKTFDICLLYFVKGIANKIDWTPKNKKGELSASDSGELKIEELEGYIKSKYEGGDKAHRLYSMGMLKIIKEFRGLKK